MDSESDERRTLTEFKNGPVVSTVERGLDTKEDREIPVSIHARCPPPETLVELPGR